MTMYNPIKSSVLVKVPATRIHQEKTRESNMKNFHSLEKRKDFVVETFIKSETSSMKQNITVVNLECKEFCDIDLQRNSEILDRELLNSKIRNSFAILKPSKELPFNSQTDPRIIVSEKTNLPESKYKRQDKRVCNQNSPIPNKKHEPEKYQRDKQRVAQRPFSQPARTEIEKYIEAFETNGYFSQRKSGDAQIFNLSLKSQNPRKYKRQERFVERPYSQTSWEEIEKHIKSFELKNKDSYFHESRELNQNFRPSSREEDFENPERKKIQILEKSHSKRPQNKIERASVELDKYSFIQLPCNDIWVEDQNSSQHLGEKKQKKYKRSEHRLAERPYSQPSKTETEKFLKLCHKQKNSQIQENQNNKSLRNEDENLAPFEEERSPEKYKRKSQFKERPSSEIFGSRIREYIETLESKKKSFRELNFDQFVNQKQNQNNFESKTNSIKYERYQSSSADKPSFQISRTDLKNFQESYEIDGKALIHQPEKFVNQSRSEPLNTKIKVTEQKYSRCNQNNYRSESAPTVFIQTNVPNYFEYSKVDSSGYGFVGKKQNYIKEAEETEEHPVELKHDMPRRKTTSLLTGERLESPDLIILQQDQSHLKNGHSDKKNVRNKESKDTVSNFLTLRSIFNRRPNKKVGEDIPDNGSLKKNKDPKSESYSPIAQQHQKERPLRNYPSKSLPKNNSSDWENTQTELDDSRITEQIFPVHNKPDNTSKANKSNQDNGKNNQILLNSVQTNAPLYYLKLPHEKKSHSIKGKDLKESPKLLKSCEGNMSINSSIDSLSSSPSLEKKISVKNKYASLQDKNERNFGHLTKDIIQKADNKNCPLSKKNKSCFKYHHSENNINPHDPDSSPSHSLDKEVLKSKENHSVSKNTENLESSMDVNLSLVRVKNGQNQSSENEMGPAKLDWSISEISIVENEGEAEELTRSLVDRSTLSPVGNDASYVSNDFEVSKKIPSNSLGESSKGYERSFSSLQPSKVSKTNNF